jgi:type I restriction enzyme S subunit
MKKSNNVPQIRFKGFNESWKVTNLEAISQYEVSSLTTNDVLKKGKYEVFDANSMIGYINDKCIKEKYITIIKDGSGVGKTRLLKNNSYFIGTMGAILAKKSDILFVYSLMQRFDFSKYIIGATIPHIYYSNYSNEKINVPSINEQNKIGILFQNLDNIISLQKEKHEQLQNIKKSLLENMFPSEGKDVPKIRFKGFNEKWHKVLFGDALETITDFVAAGSFADLAENVEYKNTPDFAQLIRTTDLKQKFNNNDCVYVDNNAFNFLWRVNLDKESIILPNIGNCGEVYYINPSKLPYKNNVLGPNAILVRSQTFENRFLSFCFESDRFQNQLSLIVSPTGQTKFNKTELKTLDLFLPNYHEQIKIGQLFEKIDALIELNQDKIDKFESIKKSLLDNMFV